MPKINQEEYEMLLFLNNTKNWLARDSDQDLFAYEQRPNKSSVRGQWESEWDNSYVFVYDLFKFIRWKDEEPYNIAELIEEYKLHKRIEEVGTLAKEAGEKMSESIRQLGVSYGGAFNESEEKEVKDIGSLKREIERDVERTFGEDEHPYIRGQHKAYSKVLRLLNQLPEPEITEEQAWEVISGEYSEEVLQNNIDYVEANGYAVIEKPTIPIFAADWIEECKKNGFTVLNEFDDLQGSLTSQNMKKEHELYFWLYENFDTFAKAWLAYPNIEVEEEQKYYVLNNENKLLLSKNNDDEVNTYNQSYPQARQVLSDLSHYQLTEQEIKDYDLRYWTFAEPVEETEYRLSF